MSANDNTCSDKGNNIQTSGNSSVGRRVKNDLVGMRFGQLEVLRYAGKGKWECLCDCGNIKDIYTSHLTGGYVKSCGHGKSNVFIDLTNKRFGSILVREYIKEIGMWDCLCDCGNTRVARGYELRNGKITMCKNCFNKSKTNDLTGRRFGKWEVLSYSGNRKWECRCDCGAIHQVFGRNLLMGKSSSCAKCSWIDKATDLVGKRYGSLTVLKYILNSVWKCRCDCGNIIEVSTMQLKNRKIEMCIDCYNRLKIDSIGIREGNQFGEWTVLNYAGDGYWRCRCSCGTESAVLGYNLKSGVTESCGCKNFKDMTGMKIHEWTVLKYEGNGYWSCRCSCGTVRNLSGYELRLGGIKSCGCKKREHARSTLLKKYGEVAPIKINDRRTIIQIKALENRENLIKFIEGIDWGSDGSDKPTTYQLSKEIGITVSPLLEYIHKYKLENYIDIGAFQSIQEDEIYNIIKRLINSDDIVRGDRKLLQGREVDIYMPNNKLAIEFNGNYWHSDIYKNKGYHQKKTIDCIKKGVQLIHVFEYEWEDLDTRNKIIELIKNRLGNKEDKRVIYGRQARVVELDSNTSNEFLDKYHLQGKSKASVKLGLVYENEIIGVMTFGIPRFSSQYDYEMIRFAWIHGANVIGGAEKLFKHFIVKYMPRSIVSYCDISKFHGSVYTRLGFEATMDNITEPGYVWVDIKTNTVFKRYQTMKHKLIEMGLSRYGNTEDEIMRNLGFYKIYNSGNIKFTWQE